MTHSLAKVQTQDIASIKSLVGARVQTSADAIYEELGIPSNTICTKETT